MPTQARSRQRAPAKPQRKRPQAPAKRSRGWRNLPAVVIAAVLASLLDRAVLYLRTPTPVLQPWPGAAHDPQHAQHLHALHHNPSDEFCAAEPPLVCAHGGDSSGGAPVNTLEAFEAALQQGVPCLEVDVARTSDGQLVVLHPRDLAQLLASESGNASGSGSGSDGSGSGPAAQAGTCSDGEESCDAAADPGGSAAGQEPLPQVGDFSWGELAALRWPGGQRVATAEEVLRLVVPAAQYITLDVKGHAGKGGEADEKVLAAAVVDLIAHTDCRQCLVWAKSDGLVQRVKELSPAQPVGYIVLNETAAAREAGMHRLLRLPRAEVAALHHSMADAEVTQKLRAAGQRVHAWTANTAGMMRAVLDAGVHAVVTDHPRHLLAALEARLHACNARQSAAAEQAAAEPGEQAA
ncbi:hypothetical protein COHA_002928 [Chlorella ohadii]|uniref:glycerophosphodiester phosphodiesterase n=1 Tax=Chlorella ohadii TaxID=2649997 RepID=A0A5P4ND60_9CHLO|nr:hypothetical protein COHA_002928 [Chlorella ohadii]QFB70716.1 chloroplast putative glycerophosphodiester phosphodiesterase 1 [Chlorella ohadii]